MSDDGDAAVDDAAVQEKKAGKSTVQSEEKLLLKILSDGFTSMRRRRDRDPTVDPTSKRPLSTGEQDFLSHVVVNFIDPTSSTGSLVKPPKPDQKPPLELFGKMSTIFEREYASTLRYVPYQHFRSGANGVIESLVVRPVMIPSHGGLLSVAAGADGEMAPWGGAVGKARDSSDPSEWHNGPFCHVYIAACDSLEHYRNKVKPSIQAFVSQLEAAAATSVKGPTDAVSGLCSPRYVIVFVPSGVRSHQSNDGPRNRVGVFSRMAAARQRMSATRDTVSRDLPADSAHSGTTSVVSDSSDLDQEGSESGSAQHPSSASGPHLSKIEKEVARRLAVDFPAGNLCTMTTLVDVKSDDAEDVDESQLQKLEWNSFMKAMGSAIVEGFRDRCRRYDEELRKLDSQRGANGKSDASDGETKADTADKGFNLSHFFLVKESFAFTYEQMCIPAEALLQYDELRAFLPDVETKSSMNGDASTGSRMSGSERSDREGQKWSSLSQMALAGDSVGFRRRIRTMDSLDPVAHVVEKYLFIREAVLLFKMNNPVYVVKRCFSFVKTFFDLKMKIMDGLDDKDIEKRSTEIHRWAFDFCWDVKRASDCYLISDSGDELEGSQRTGDEQLARVLCILLEFARLRLLKLGDILQPGNPIRSGLEEDSDELQTPWAPWEPSAREEDESSMEEVEHDAANFLDDALSSGAAFQSRYLELTKVLVSFNERCCRYRYAARLRIEAMEIYVRQREKEKAAAELKSIADIYFHDQWSACHFHVMFRLAALQRLVGTPVDYLGTLVQCFNENSSIAAPLEALDALYDDLCALVLSPLVTSCRFSAPPLFLPALSLEGALSSHLKKKRNLLKQVYSVGETVTVTLSLMSHVSKEIEVDALTVSLVPFRSYVSAMEDSTAIKDDEIFRELKVRAPVRILPGPNEYTIEWIPMSSGQFILSSIAMKWKEARFTYTAKELQQPTIRVDIVPCEPTQSLSVKPPFLLPGHEQPVHVSFSAGSDVIKEGTAQFAGSPGLLLLPPGNDKATGDWVPSCEIPLPSCPLGETIVLTAMAKTSLSEEGTLSADSVPTMHVKVSTSYLHASSESIGSDMDSSSIPRMETSMEAQISTLAHRALSVEDVELVLLPSDKAIVNVTLQCSTPVALTVKSWRICLPDYLSMSEDGDMNESLVDARVAAGEHLHFGFDCVLRRAENMSPAAGPILHVELADECGIAFTESLKLGLKRPLAPRASLPNMPCVSVKVTSSLKEGCVGEPITISYVVDPAGFANRSKQILYEIRADESDWLVSGKTEGYIDGDGMPDIRLDFIGIPARPGNISRYPALSLASLVDGGPESIPLQVDLVAESPYNSLCPPSHVSVAFPVAVEAKKESIDADESKKD